MSKYGKGAPSQLFPFTSWWKLFVVSFYISSSIVRKIKLWKLVGVCLLAEQSEPEIFFLFSETRRRRRTAGESTEVLRTNFSPNIVWTDVAINITFDFKESVTRWNIWLQHSRLKRLQNESNKIIENGVKTRIRKSRFVDPKLSFSTGNECWRPSSCSRLFRRSRTSPWRRWATASRWVRAWGQP